jgi:hypothetical protein
MDINEILQQILFGKALGESPADAKLNQAGSVMGSQKTQQRESEARQGPALSTLSKGIEMANPINWMGGMGGSSAAIAPTGNKILQQLMQALYAKAPKLMDQVQDTGRMVYPYLTESLPAKGAVGTYQNLNPLAGNVNVYGMQSQDEMMKTLAHELRHFLTDPTLATKKPVHAAETAQQITKMLPPRQQNVMQNQYTAPFDWHLNMPSNRPKEALQSQLIGNVRRAEEVPMHQPKDLQEPALRAYNESLSYLTEALLEGNKGGDPALEAIANALGQGIR